MKKTKSVSFKASKVSSVPPPAGGPGGPMEIVFSFDTTGSMSSCLVEVRTKLQEIVERLFADLPNLRIAIFAHGDYCDAANYITKHVDFTNNVKHLCDFVSSVGPTGGGDSDECYELVLREVREKLAWSAGTQRVLVMIGDASPHGVDYPQNTLKIDWKEEVKALKKEMGVTIYGVEANSFGAGARFWKDIASMTGGKHLSLKNFSTIVDMMMAVCYREHGPEFFEAYEAEVRAREGAGIRHELTHMLDTLRPDGSSAPVSAAPASSTSTKGAKKRKPTAVLAKGAKKGKATPDVDTGVVSAKPSAKRVYKPKGASKKKASSEVLKKALKVQRDTVKYSIGKLYREMVPNTEFSLNSLPWCSWKLAMTDKKPTNSASNWHPRPSRPGFRNCQLFSRDSKCTAVYEFAVQPAGRARKYPMYCRTTKGFSRLCWDSYLLSNPRIKKEIDRVLAKGCKLFVRRAKITSYPAPGTTASSLKELKAMLRDTYDYAWDMLGRPHRRQVEKKGKLISSITIKPSSK